MEITLDQLIQIGMFLIGYTTLLYAIFHSNKK